MVEYDKIADKYLENISIKRIYMYDPIFFAILGDVKGKCVMDLACGDGYYTRTIKKLGAKEVVGVDISKEMIKIAKEKEQEQKLGIKYVIYNAINMPKMGDFDIITGTFLLHYSRTQEELINMCKNVYKNLKEGGRFIALNNNPKHPLQPWKKYGVLVRAVKDKPLEDGDQMEVVFLKDGKEDISFKNYYWSEATYKKSLRDVGFKDIQFYDAKVSEDKLEKDGKEFWREYLKQPGVAVIECFK